MEEDKTLYLLLLKKIYLSILSNELGNIISTVPICKISNIIKWIIRRRD